MKYGIIFLFLITLLSCGKNETSRIPDVYVNFNISVVQFDAGKNQFDVLLVPGHGVAGLVIYKVSPNNYKAYDRCSAVDPEKKCAVVSEDSFTLTDPCSGAKYLLMDGSPAKAPAVRSLKEYNITLINNNQIMITNSYGGG